MLNKLTIDQVLLQAKSYVNKGKIAEAQGLYQSILNTFPNNIRAKQGLINLENQPLDVSSHLINLYSKRKFLDILNYTNNISDENSHSLVIWSIRGASAAQIGFLDDAKK